LIEHLRKAQILDDDEEIDPYGLMKKVPTPADDTGK
jgi:hypothetical protein